MPGKVEKKDGYSVKLGGRTTAKHTTRKRAEGQLRLLRGVEHGWKPTGNWSERKKKRGK